MHERSPKNSAMDTLLYEFDMLRHCAKTVDDKRLRSHQSERDRAEYYLGIEGFILHFRNVLGFFINKEKKFKKTEEPTDLIINRPEQWTTGEVEKNDYQDLTERATEIDRKHGLTGGGDDTCYQKISWFLQHCTIYRHRLPRQWDIAQMFADIEPLLKDFVGRFSPKRAKVEVVSSMLGRDSHHTSTVTERRFGPPQAKSLNK